MSPPHQVVRSLCCLILCTFIPIFARAACSHTYVVHTVPTLGYNAFYGANEQLLGITPDLINELSQQTGCRLSIQVVPPGRIDAMSKNGRVAILALAGHRHRPDRLFIPLVASPFDMVIRRDLGVRSATAAHDDSRVLFGRVEGLSYGIWGEAYLATLPTDRVDISPTVDDLYHKLTVGRVNATMGFPILYLRNLDAMGLRDMVDIIPIKDAKRTILGVALSTNEITPEDLRRLQLGLEAMRQDGTFLRILARWVGDSVARDQLWRADRDAAMDTQP